MNKLIHAEVYRNYAITIHQSVDRRYGYHITGSHLSGSLRPVVSSTQARGKRSPPLTSGLIRTAGIRTALIASIGVNHYQLLLILTSAVGGWPTEKAMALPLRN